MRLSSDAFFLGFGFKTNDSDEGEDSAEASLPLDKTNDSDEGDVSAEEELLGCLCELLDDFEDPTERDCGDAIELLGGSFDCLDDPTELGADAEGPLEGMLVGALDDSEDSAKLDGDEATLLLDKTKNSDEKDDSGVENLEKLSEVVKGVDSTELDPIVCTDDGGAGKYSGPPLKVYERLTLK